ncbi:MAG TPA: hypothetical protein ENI82_00235 [Bacteroidetes bacterium]|nr:hypothetical protein [Bacteroidota bacterium]
MKKLIFICTILFLLSCGKEKPPLTPTVPEPTDTTSSNSLVIWQIPLTEDTSACFSIDTEMINDGILFSCRPAGFVTRDELLRMVDKETGSLIWEWDNYITTTVGQSAENVKVIEDQIIVMNSSQDNYGIDANTGQTVWSILIEDGNPYISSYGNLIFHTSSYGGSPISDSTNIRYCNGRLGDWQEIIKFYKTDEYEVNCKNPSAYVNHEGDTIIFFKVTQLDISPYDVKVDFYCYNMTRDSILWMKEDFDPAGESNHNPPLIDGDYVYHVGVREVFCFDKFTGETIWQWGFPFESWTFFQTDYLTHGDKFILSRTNGDLFALNKLTGEVIWVIEDHKAGFTPTSMTVYNDKLYYGSGDFYIIDINEGKVRRSFPSPNTYDGFPSAIFRNNVTIDEENKRMYTTDEYFLICMRLLE